MKKQVFFAVCVTAATAAVFTGCATKQQAAAQRSQTEATEIAATETQQEEAAVCEEPVITTETAAEPKEAAAPAAIEEAAKPAPTSQAVRPAAVEYVVTAGDSVSALSVRFNVRQADILAMNPALRSNPSNLRIGQKVLFPAGTDVTKKAVRRESSAQPANAPRAAGTVIYTVKSGDVLGGIANKHGVTIAAIKSANKLKNDNIWVGQKLTIPNAAKKPTEAKAKTVAPAKKEQAKPAKAAEPEVAPVEEPVVDVPEAESAPTEIPEQRGEDEVLPPEPEVPQAAAPVQSENVHVVKEGEDLVSIAILWGVTPLELRRLNGFDDATETPLAPGTTLKVPLPTSAQ